MLTLRTTAMLMLLLVAAGCSKKQEVLPQAIAGEHAKPGASLAYQHRLRIQLAAQEIAPRMTSVREACDAARFGECLVLRMEQEEHSSSIQVRIVPAGVEPLTALATQHGTLTSRNTWAEDLGEAVADNQRKLKQMDAYAAQLDQLGQRKDVSVSDLVVLAQERAKLETERDNLVNVAAQQQRRIDTNTVELNFSDGSRGRSDMISLADWSDELEEGVGDALRYLAYGMPFLLLAFPIMLFWRWIWRRATRASRRQPQAR